MNSAMDTTPTLDRMATESVVFENAIAPGPRTPSSIPEITTGEALPKSAGGEQHWREAMMQSITNHVDRYETIAERFEERGYSTAAYTANPWTLRTTNFDAGFDQFHEIGSSSSGRFQELFSETAVESVARIADKWWDNEGWFSQWRTFYEDLNSTIDQLNEPYFVWVFLLDTHNPYLVPRQDREESTAFGTYYSTIRGNSIIGDSSRKTNYREEIPSTVEHRLKRAYRDTIRSVDRFVDTLWNDRADEDPVMVLHADHGEAFNEHGTYGHQRQLYEENIHVPLLVYNAGSTDRVHEPVSLRALPEIMLAATDEDDLTRWTADHVCSRTDDGVSMAVRSERWKYISSDNDEELYDLTTDPREERNVIDSYDDKADELRAALASFVAELPEESTTQAEAVDQGVTDRLESLGYK